MTTNQLMTLLNSRRKGLVFRKLHTLPPKYEVLHHADNKASINRHIFKDLMRQKSMKLSKCKITYKA